MKTQPEGMRFHKMRDITPAVFFHQSFAKRYEFAAIKKFGDVIPNDNRALYDLATTVLAEMEPSEGSGR